MADEKKGPQEDKIFSKLTGGAGQPLTGLTSFTGLLRKNPSGAGWHLYLGLDMSKYVEINDNDIVHTEQLPADRSPFGSLGGTQVFVKQNAQVNVVQTSSQTKDASEFDLDIRLGAAGAQVPAILGTRIGGGVGGTCETCFTQCDDTCPRTQCDTCPITHCQTCFTACGATCPRTQCNTCLNTCQTCQTHCNQNTCATCQTQCNQQTCATCQTQCGQQTCGQQTCVTCHTCLTQCNQATCNTCFTRCDQATCPRTECGGTCVTCIRPVCPLPQ